MIKEHVKNDRRDDAVPRLRADGCELVTVANLLLLPASRPLVDIAA